MSSKAKKTAVKKPRKVLRDNIQGLSKPAIKRVARQAGVLRLDGQVYDELRGVVKVQLEQIIQASLTFTEHGRRTTVSTKDVLSGIESATGEKMAFDASTKDLVRC